MKREKCMFKKFSNVKISAIASASGKEQHDVAEICSSFLDERHVKRLIKTLGFEKIRQIPLNMTTADMCVQLSNDLLEELKVSKSSIDALIFVTQTNDSIAPASVFSMQNRIGLSSDCYLNNIINGCAGSMHGLLEGISLISAGMASKVLVCFGDTYCKLHELADADQKANVALFGDGAGAVVLRGEESESAEAVYTAMAHSAGDKGEALTLQYGTEETPVIRMDGQAVFKFAVRKVPEIIEEMLKKADVSREDVDYFVLHQANRRIIEAAAKRVGVEIEKFPMNLGEYANTSAASVPILLNEMNRDGKLKRGQKIILAGFGAGLTWAGCLMEW